MVVRAAMAITGAEVPRRLAEDQVALGIALQALMNA
jgi:hypothetical protein